jgi:hypothetical protein
MLKYKGLEVPTTRRKLLEGACCDRLFQKLHCSIYECLDEVGCGECIYGEDHLKEFKEALATGILPEIEVVD